MIQVPQFSYFRNAEIVQFIDNTISIVTTNDPTALNVLPQAELLSERFIVLERLFILDQGNEITKEIQALDGRRDNAQIGINANVDSFQKHFEEEKRQAAELLGKLLNKYGRDLHRRSYPEQTAGTRSMVNELQNTPALAAAAATLHLTEWFAELATANDLFDKKYLDRNEAYADAPKEKFADVRKETEAAYMELVKHLSAHAVITPGEAYDRVTGQLDQLVAAYNQTVKSRIGSGSEAPVIND